MSIVYIYDAHKVIHQQHLGDRISVILFFFKVRTYQCIPENI